MSVLKLNTRKILFLLLIAMVWRKSITPSWLRICIAALSLATCSPNFLILEGIETWSGFQAELLEKPVQWEDGYVVPSSEPGLGVSLNEAVARANPWTGDELHLQMGLEPVR